MKKINLKTITVTCIVCLLPILLGIAYRNKLPNSVAIHFDANNQPDGYFSRNQFIFLIPVVMCLLQVACCVLGGMLTKKKKDKEDTVLKWYIPMLTIVIYVVTLSYALGKDLDIRKICMIIIGVTLIVCGFLAPKTQGKIRLGVKGTKNKKLEKKFSKNLKMILIIDGILLLVSILFKTIVSAILLGVVVVEGIIISIYCTMKRR